LNKRMWEEEYKNKYTIKETKMLCEKFKSRKTIESHANSLYY